MLARAECGIRLGCGASASGQNVQRMALGRAVRSSQGGYNKAGASCIGQCVLSLLEGLRIHLSRRICRHHFQVSLSAPPAAVAASPAQPARPPRPQPAAPALALAAGRPPQVGTALAWLREAPSWRAVRCMLRHGHLGWESAGKGCRPQPAGWNSYSSGRSLSPRDLESATRPTPCPAAQVAAAPLAAAPLTAPALPATQAVSVPAQEEVGGRGRAGQGRAGQGRFSSATRERICWACCA